MVCKMKDITMKTKTRHFINAGAVLFAVALTFMACDDKPFELELPLAVTSHQLDLAQPSGSTHIMVYSTGSWSAVFAQQVDWASLNKMSGEGNADLVFSYSANYGVSRYVDLILSKGSELSDTIRVCQAGKISEPSLTFKNSAVSLLKTAASITTPLTTNLIYNLSDITGEIMYLGAEGDTLGVTAIGEDKSASYDQWVKDVKWSSSDVAYNVQENTSDFPRTAVLKIRIVDADGKETLTSQTITQGISDPEFKLDSESAFLAGYSGNYVFPASSNNIYAYTNNIVFTVDPSDEESVWISGVKLTDSGLSLSVTKNETGATRSGSVTVSFTDSSGDSITQKLSIDQKSYPFSISFAAVRAMSPGDISVDQYIEGYVVSDPGSANVAQNPQTAQFKFDFTENYKTAYIESKDGKYGFMLKFATTEDNILERYSLVRISLAGTTLVKDSDPDRFSLTGLTADNVIETKTPDSFLVPVKEKTIAELTDDDIYTLVTLKDMEILCKDGCFTNATDGYSFKDVAKGINPTSGTTSAPRWDVAPLIMSDKSGNSIYMLTNSYVPWRRDGTPGNNDSVIPQGSGSFVGIVVVEDLVRYGDLGRYEVRAMEKADIAFSDSKFSKTIVEWNWNDKVNDVIPEEGAGELDFHGAAVSLTTDFNSAFWHDLSGTNMKGLISNAAIKATAKWWDFTNDIGNYFDISFSTLGINGANLIFGLVWNHGDMGNTSLDSPAHWKLLYSIDGGESFNDVPDSGIIKNRSIVWWSTTSQDSCPGYIDHIRKLPSVCFGKESVVLRLQVADKVTDTKPGTAAASYLTNLGIENGTLTDKSTGIRIGTITVRYN